jgi:hypothetical protein
MQHQPCQLLLRWCLRRRELNYQDQVGGLSKIVSGLYHPPEVQCSCERKRMTRGNIFW